MALTYEDLHKLFCPYDTWEQYRLSCVTDDDKVIWSACLSDYCKAVRRQVNREIKTAAMKIEAEIRDKKMLEQKLRKI